MSTTNTVCYNLLESKGEFLANCRCWMSRMSPWWNQMAIFQGAPLWNQRPSKSEKKGERLLIWSMWYGFLVYLALEMSIASENKCFAIHYCWAGIVSTCLFISYFTFSNQYSISSKCVLMSLGDEKKMCLSLFEFTKISCETINTRTFRNLIKFQDFDFKGAKLLVFSMKPTLTSSLVKIVHVPLFWQGFPSHTSRVRTTIMTTITAYFRCKMTTISHQKLFNPLIFGQLGQLHLESFPMNTNEMTRICVEK